MLHNPPAHPSDQEDYLKSDIVHKQYKHEHLYVFVRSGKLPQELPFWVLLLPGYQHSCLYVESLHFNALACYGSHYVNNLGNSPPEPKQDCVLFSRQGSGPVVPFIALLFDLDQLLDVTDQLVVGPHE